MHKEIRSFIQKEHLLTLSVVESKADSKDLEVYSASCYYAFFEPSFSLIFKSNETSKHIQLAEKNPFIGVSIARDSDCLSHIEGVQIKAEFRRANTDEIAEYYKRFPIARAVVGSVFSLEIYFAKYTNNKLLLKEKLTFTR